MGRHSPAPRRTLVTSRHLGATIGVLAVIGLGATAGLAATGGLGFSGSSDTPADGGVYRTTVEDGKLKSLEFVPDPSASAAATADPAATGGASGSLTTVVPAPTLATTAPSATQSASRTKTPTGKPPAPSASGSVASGTSSTTPATTPGTSPGGAVDAVDTGDWLSGMSGDDPASFGTWRGTPVEIVGTWADQGENQTTPYTVTDGEGQFAGPIDIGVGALLNGESWARAAAGDYDTRWQASLEYMADARAGKGTTYIRFAHESNGDWYPWQVRESDVANFKAAWRRYTAIQREVFPDARMVFNVNGDSAQDFDWRTTFPGRDVVDVMSVDYYNWYPGVNDAAAFASTYARTDEDGAPRGLEAHRAFAASVGLPLAISEWSGAANQGDNPEYMSLFHDWLSTHGGSGPGQVLYEIVFNIGGYDGNNFQLNPDTDQPRAAARYREEF